MAAVNGTSDDPSMFREVVRLAVTKPEDILERLSNLRSRVARFSLCILSDRG
jgi:hypothetical protein